MMGDTMFYIKPLTLNHQLKIHVYAVDRNINQINIIELNIIITPCNW